MDMADRVLKVSVAEHVKRLMRWYDIIRHRLTRSSDFDILCRVFAQYPKTFRDKD